MASGVLSIVVLGKTFNVHVVSLFFPTFSFIATRAVSYSIVDAIGYYVSLQFLCTCLRLCGPEDLEDGYVILISAGIFCEEVSQGCIDAHQAGASLNV